MTTFCFGVYIVKLSILPYLTTVSLFSSVNAVFSWGTGQDPQRPVCQVRKSFSFYKNISQLFLDEKGNYFYIVQSLVKLSLGRKTTFYMHKNTEAEFLDEIQTKVLKVFLLAIHSHLYTLQLCLEISISSNSHNLLIMLKHCFFNCAYVRRTRRLPLEYATRAHYSLYIE